jgi:hypothetical protein
MTETQETLSLDLTRPPSRVAVGMPDGKDQYTHQTKQFTDFPVRILLPGGRQLAFDARSVGVDSLRAADPPSDPPTTLDILLYPATLDLAHEHLLATAGEFGLDLQAVQDWYDQARAPQADRPVRSRWLRTTWHYLKLEVRANHQPGRTSVHYVLTWG